MSVWAVVALAIVVAAIPGEGVAQDAETLAPGARVRVLTLSPSEAVVGRLIGIDEEKLTLRVEERAVVLKRSEIHRLYLSAGRGSRLKQAGIGLLAGAALGAVAGFASGDDPPGFLAFSASEKAGIFAVALAPVGALVGGAITPAERWQDAPELRLPTGSGMSPTLGVGLSLTVRF